MSRFANILRAPGAWFRRRAAGATENLTEWQDESGAVLGSVNAAGDVALGISRSVTIGATEAGAVRLQQNFVGVYDLGNNRLYGMQRALPAVSVAGIPVSAIGGYYRGLGVGGSSNNTNNPIFGVLTSTQSGNGAGFVAFTVYDNNKVQTFHNTLDDGAGNAMLKTLALLSGSKVLDGAGAPEGSVAAPPGSLYLRTNGDLYRKASGVGNTGWLLLSPDPSSLAVRSQKAPAFVKQATPVFTRANSPWAVSANEKLYWPWVIDAKSVYPAATAQFYMYYSTDHASGVGGIGVATAHSPLGPWTDLGTKMYVDTTSGTSQTETPSVVWNAEAGLFYMYYQQKTSVTDQSTLLATSANGIANWTRVGVVITTPGDVRAGDGHSGYARVFRHGNIWIAHHLSGGMSRAHFGTSYSRDGLTWNTDPRAIAGQTSLWGDGITVRGVDHLAVSPFWWKGRMWAAMQHGPYVAGTESNGKQILLGLYDGPFDYWVYSEMLKPGQYAWDLNSVYQPHVMPYGDKLYLYFLTDGTDLNGAIGCAVAEAA